MSLDAERAAIEGRFKQHWTAGSPPALRTEVGWDGQTFEPPKTAASVQLTIIGGDSFNASMGSPGSNLVRYVGVLHLRIRVPGGKGSAAAKRLADLIRPIFTNWRSGGLTFGTMDVGAPDDSTPFYTLPVRFAFERDEFHG